MKLLNEWICDSCGEVIEHPDDGIIIWRKNDNEKIDDILIVHKKNTSEDCDIKGEYKGYLSIEEALGTKGIITLLNLIDPGVIHMPDYKENIENMRKFLEVFRRVQIPYYEEARVYLEKAYYDGFLDGIGETLLYYPDTLKSIIEKYSNRKIK